MPCLKGLDTALNSGLRAAAVDREVVTTAPGGRSKDEVVFTRPDAVSANGPRARENAATLRKVFRRQLGERSGGPISVDGLVAGAMRYAEKSSAEMGFARRTSRLTRARPRVPVCARDCPSARSDPALMLRRPFLSNVAPVLCVELYRLLEGVAGFQNLSGWLKEGEGRGPRPGTVSAPGSEMAGPAGQSPELCSDDAGDSCIIGLAFESDVSWIPLRVAL